MSPIINGCYRCLISTSTLVTYYRNRYIQKKTSKQAKKVHLCIGAAALDMLRKRHKLQEMQCTTVVSTVITNNVKTTDPDDFEMV